MRYGANRAAAPLAVCCCAALAACAGQQRAMARYYANHPEMMARLLKVRSVCVEDVRGARSEEDAAEMRKCLIDELRRRGRGRFRVAASPGRADALLQTDMTEELGPVPEEEPLPFTLEPKLVSQKVVYARMKLVDPRTGRLIYKTDTREQAEFDVNSIEKAAYSVVRNLMKEIDYCRRTISP